LKSHCEYVAFGQCPGRYSWIEQDGVVHTAAHELGHNFGFEDLPLGYDDENLMYNLGSGYLLREYQWWACNKE